MIRRLKSGVQRVANALGYKLERLGAPSPPHRLELDPAYADIIARVKPFTMTSCERIASLVDAVRHVTRSRIPGAVVECGVWRGGSMMAAALALLEAGDERDLYLFDTFAGMTAPTEHDVDHRGDRAAEIYRASLADDHSAWCHAQPGRREGQPAVDRLPGGEAPLHQGRRAGDDPGGRRPRRSPSCASTPTGTPRPGTSWRTSIRDWRPAGC